MFIVLEGSDGSGKTTQFRLLSERLKAAGHNIDVYDFPRYSEPSSHFVQRYLNGEYGPASEVSPYTASLFYALDRFEAAPLIRQSLSEDKIILANRYTGSNMAHQGAKFTKSGEQRGFFVWADSLEFQLLGIPRPTINIFLRVPAEVAYELIKKKTTRNYTTKIHDEHEADLDHLRQSVAAYDSLCQLFPKDFIAIDCTRNNKILPVTEINNLIWETLKPLLPKPSRPGHSAVISLSDKLPLTDEQKTLKPVESSARTDSGFEESFEVKDVSLLVMNNLLGHSLNIEYELEWPPARSKPKLNYYTPAELPPKLAEKYKLTMDELVSLSSKMNKSLPNISKTYLNYVVPMAALVDAKINGSQESTNQLLARTSSTGLTELRQITKQVRTQLKEPQALRQIIKEIADIRPGGNSASFDQPVKLLAALPRNEFDLLADCLYPYSNLARQEIAAEIDNWTYEQKVRALKTLCRTDTESVLKKIQYRFDVVDNLPTLQALANSMAATEIQLQPPTPRYGYSVPGEIEKAGCDEEFIACFDLSLELFSDMQAAEHEELAGYAVLLGHRQRWQFNASGRAMYRQYPSQTPYGAILKSLREQIAEVHPLITESVSKNFVNDQPQAVHRTLAQAKPPGSKRPRKRRGTKSKK